MRELLKSAARGIALIAVLPSLASYFVRSAILGRNLALEGSTQMLSLVPGLIGQYMRRAFLSKTIEGCGPDSVIAFGTIFSQAGARIGDRAYVGPGCFLGLVDIGEGALVASGVHITSGRHTHGTADAATPAREQEGQRTRVTIGAGAWIGSAAVVMADVGANSIVGAGAVVTEAIPPSVLAAGVPAKVLRQRT